MAGCCMRMAPTSQPQKAPLVHSSPFPLQTLPWETIYQLTFHEFYALISYLSFPLPPKQIRITIPCIKSKVYKFCGLHQPGFEPESSALLYDNGRPKFWP